MAFNFLGTMREAQWKCFRNWVLTERQSVAPRLKVIDAELQKIGHITVTYKTVNQTVQTGDGAEKNLQNVTEERESFTVSAGSTLEKLVQAFISQGGNPMAISMFLQPDQTQFTTPEDPDESITNDSNELFTDIGPESTPAVQPGRGVMAPMSGDYGPGGQYKGGLSTSLRDMRKIVGRYFPEGEAGAKIAIRMNHARKWVGQELAELTRMEVRIMKIMDLREQLSQERNTLIQQAIGGSVPDFPLPPDRDRFARNLHLTRIVTEMDSVFYKTGPDGEIDFDEINLRADDGTDLNNVTPGGLAFYDTLIPNPAGTDDFAV